MGYDCGIGHRCLWPVRRRFLPALLPVEFLPLDDWWVGILLIPLKIVRSATHKQDLSTDPKSDFVSIVCHANVSHDRFMTNERRRARRFPLRREARYTILEPHKKNLPVGTQTLDMSSGGMCLRCKDAPALGSRMDVAVSWPAVLENGCRLKLVARGRVMWRSNDAVGLMIERHEFRTQGTEFTTTVVAGAGL